MFNVGIDGKVYIGLGGKICSEVRKMRMNEKEVVYKLLKAIDESGHVRSSLEAVAVTGFKNYSKLNGIIDGLTIAKVVRRLGLVSKVIIKGERFEEVYDELRREFEEKKEG